MPPKLSYSRNRLEGLLLLCIDEQWLWRYLGETDIIVLILCRLRPIRAITSLDENQWLQAQISNHLLPTPKKHSDCVEIKEGCRIIAKAKRLHGANFIVFHSTNRS